MTNIPEIIESGDASLLLAQAPGPPFSSRQKVRAARFPSAPSILKGGKGLCKQKYHGQSRHLKAKARGMLGGGSGMPPLKDLLSHANEF